MSQWRPQQQDGILSKCLERIRVTVVGILSKGLFQEREQAKQRLGRRNMTTMNMARRPVRLEQSK